MPKRHIIHDCGQHSLPISPQTWLSAMHLVNGIINAITSAKMHFICDKNDLKFILKVVPNQMINKHNCNSNNNNNTFDFAMFTNKQY